MLRPPRSVRPGDAPQESCRPQLVLHHGADGSCSALKFFHSKVDIPVGLAKTFRNETMLVIDCGMAKSSDSVKKGFLRMLSEIKGEQ